MKLHFCVFEAKALFFLRLDSCKSPAPVEMDSKNEDLTERGALWVAP